MKTMIRSTVLLSLFALSPVSFSQEQCSTVSCDCENLPTSSWMQACKNQEARLIADCVKNENKVEGYCSLHGPMANRLPLDLDLKQTELYALEDIPKLNNKVAVIYWAIIKDFDSLENEVDKRNYQVAQQKLRTIESNVDQLFEVQQTVTNSFTADNKKLLAELAWRDYSADTLSFGSDFFIQAESILNSYDEVESESQRNEFRDLGIQLMALSGKVYEQVGYAYANGMRHKHAAKAWKNAADASTLVMAHEVGVVQSSSKFRRFQSAARLHRASYHWLIGSGRGGAEESLAESQKFMDDGSSISSLVEEERQIKESRPFWSK